MDGISYKVEGTLVGKFEETAREMPGIEKLALYKAGFFLRDKIRQQLLTNVPKANVKNPKYNDTLLDAIAFTHPDGASITVNALGNRKSGSGTFRTRFFEAGTHNRFHKQQNGIKLKKKRAIGKITGNHFFSTAVNANESAVISIMEQVISKYIKDKFNG